MKNEKIVNCHCEEGTRFLRHSGYGGRADAAISKTNIILALGSEFDTRLALYTDNKIYFSENTGEIAKNPQDLENFIMDFLSNIPASFSPFGKGGKGDFISVTPTIIITDLHPLYNSTQIGEKLSKKWKVPHYKLQHHLAHIFTSLFDFTICSKFQVSSFKNIIGIACDGTGYGWDGKIWGGEVFSIYNPSLEHPALWANRLGHLEEQTLIGGDLSIAEPARMLISLLSKIYPKNDIFEFVKHYYSKKNFEVIYSQLSQNFNCQPTTSTGRVLDAISILLGFCENERKYKHYAAKAMEENSAPTRKLLAPKIQNTNSGIKILKTTNLLKYIASQLHCHSEFISGSHVDLSLRGGYCRRGNLEILKQVQNDTKHQELAALAQTYIINGLYQIAKKSHKPKTNLPIFLSGGFANNKIFQKFAAKNNIYIPQQLSPGDDNIAAGQIFWYLISTANQELGKTFIYQQIRGTKLP